jgi:hypothetical protein
MNKIDKEMEQFMKLAERDSHKFKRNNIEWSPITRVWLRQCWLLQRMQRCMAGRIRDPRNLFRECALRGIKDLRQITPDEIVAEFYVCKHNLSLPEKHSPHFRLGFLKQLATRAKKHGDTLRASSVIGIIQKKATCKRWHQNNHSTRQVRGSLMVQVKIPTTDSGFEKFKTKCRQCYSRGAIPIRTGCRLPPRYLLQGCGPSHYGPVAQQILEGTYDYLQDLDPTTRLLFEEVSATYAILSPTEIATYVTPEDFQQFWKHAC